MKIISLIGVFLICGLSFPPNAPKDTPINLNITKKEATITELPRDKICLPIWNVFAPDRPFVYSANIIFDNFNIDYDTIDNTFNEITLNNFSFNTTLEIISIDYDNTIEVQYTTTIPTAVYINQNITFNNNYGEIGFAGSLKLLNTSGSLGIGPLYQGNIYLIYISDSSNSQELWHTATEPIYNIYMTFIQWLNINSSQIISDTGITNIYNGYVLNYETYDTLIDFSEYKYYYDYGYNVGDTEGYGRGTMEGYNTGYEQGYNVGESNGYSMGFDVGYESGYIDGNEGQGDFNFVWLTTLFSSLNAILSVEILNGFRLWYLFAVPLVVALIVGVMKLLR